MDKDAAIQQDYQNGVTADAAAAAGQAAAQNGSALSPQQPNESADAFAQRQAAYNQAQQEQDQSKK